MGNGLNGLRKTGVSSSPQKSVEGLAKKVIAGKWGNGNECIKKLQANSYDYDAVQDRANWILAKKIAREVIQGDWGNGEERKKRLTEAGYDYDKV